MIVVAGAGLDGAADVLAASWLVVVPVERHDVVGALLAGGLHLGES